MLPVPETYVPFQNLRLCSNALINVRVPLAVDGNPILLIGSGHEVPLVWLAARAAPTDPTWGFVVQESKSDHPALRVVVDLPNRVVTVATGNVLLVRARAESKDFAVVDQLDLRPLGLAVHGGPASLVAGGSAFTGNAIQGVAVAFAFGVSPPLKVSPASSTGGNQGPSEPVTS